MTDPKGKREALGFAAMLALAAVLAWSPVASEDIGWHLKTGEWILANGWPTTDPFSHTLPPGTRWKDTPWLYEVTAALVHRVGGWNGLVALQVALAVALGGVMWSWLRSRGEGPLVRFAAIGVVYAASYYRSWVRAEMISCLFLALHLWWWERYFRTGRLPAARILVTQWIWSNAHSGCVLGLAVAGAAAVAAGVTWLAGRRSEPAPRSLRQVLSPALMVPFLTVVSAINPYGWSHLVYGLRESAAAPVIELLPPSWFFFVGPPGSCLLLAALGIRGMARRDAMFSWMVAGLFLVPALQFVRFFPMCAIALVPFIATGWRVFLRRPIEEEKREISAEPSGPKAADIRRVGLGVGFLAINLVVAQVNDPRRLFHGGLDDSAYPVEAANVVVREGLQGRMFNDFDVGGYLIWRLAPERRVFVDNRTDLYAALLNELRTLGLPDSFRRLLDRYSCTYAILPFDPVKPAPGDQSLAEAVADWRDWALVFWDDYGVLCVKDTPANRGVIERLAVRVIQPEWLPSPGNERTDWAWLEGISRDPARSEAARKELQQAAESSPRNLRACLGLGWFHAFRAEWAEARRWFDQAPARKDKGFEVEAGMALTAFAQGDRQRSDSALAAARACAIRPKEQAFLQRVEQVRSRLVPVEPNAERETTRR